MKPDERMEGAGPAMPPRASEAQRVTVIRPSRGWRSLDLAELWRYRDLFGMLVERDVKVRYKQTVLGSAWAILQPVMTMVVFTVLFGQFAKMPSDGVPYPIFVYAALLPWLFFANSITTAANSLVGSSNLISKVYFPRLLIPLSSIGASLVDFAIASSVLLVMMVYYGLGWSLNLLLVPFLTLGIIFAALGVGTLLAALNASYRDFRYVVPFGVQLWMFVTPVAYPISVVPEAWRWVIFLNPMTGLIDAMRAAFLGLPLNGSAIVVSLAVSVLLFAIAVAYFERVERGFADVI
ncbi:MAG: ABC transporter permease [Hyphomicrobiaceae bacterium]|nr:ABC transporter permease [Hyphomicrobiaceae bacterium]